MDESDIRTLKNLEKVLSVVGWLILTAIVQVYIAPYTEIKSGELVIIENWGWGLIGFSCFAVLYAIPSKKALFRFKKFWFFMVAFATCWIFVDWEDFVIAIGVFK